MHAAKKYSEQQCSLRRLLVTANVVPSSSVIVTLKMKALHSSETSVLTRSTRRNVPEESVLGVMNCLRLIFYVEQYWSMASTCNPVKLGLVQREDKYFWLRLYNGLLFNILFPCSERMTAIVGLSSARLPLIWGGLQLNPWGQVSLRLCRRREAVGGRLLMTMDVKLRFHCVQRRFSEKREWQV
jgi:hypothetical protein